MNPIKVDIWSDIACPWCYIGKRRFEAALAAYEGADDVVIEYHSFELAPDTPVDFEGSEVDFLVEHKGMPAEQVRHMLEQMTQMGASEGLTYDFNSLQHTKTLKAHELLHFAKARGKQAEMKERLLKAYFTEGKHVGRIPELAALAAEVGLDADEATRALESGELSGAVAQDIAQGRELGITGVPFFVFGGKYGVSGAQSPDTFAQVLTRVASEQRQEVGEHAN